MNQCFLFWISFERFIILSLHMAGAQGSLRIAVVQFAPKIGQVQANIAKARQLCAKCVY